MPDLNKLQTPCIGISVNLKEGTNCVADAYISSVIRAGGVPVLIPALKDEESLIQILSKVDGIVLTGGGDIDPDYFNEIPIKELGEINELRDAFDIALIKLASARQIPILGICRGLQVINVAFGGSLYQDIISQYRSPLLEHNQELPREEPSHTVKIVKDSFLETITGKTELQTNSFHHQAIKIPADDFLIAATSSDGIIEAFEAPFKHIYGVQWHPENMTSTNEDMLNLFRFFINEASLFKQARSIHKQIITIDSHSDTPMFFEKNINIGQKNDLVKIDIPKMQEGMLDAVFMVAYLKQGERDIESSKAAVEKAMSIISQIHQQAEKNKEIVGIAYSVSDVERLKKEHKKAIFIGIENGYAIGKDIDNLIVYKKAGVSYITLCHNGNNDICDSASSDPEHNGLSEFGRKIVRKLNELGIMVDISHTSEKTSFDVIGESKFPVIASHSSVKAICNHSRNLSDDLMKAIAEKGGVVQICFYSDFISSKEKVTIKDAIDHIDYAVKLIGIDHVGIGTDMDGGGGFTGIDAANEAINITTELLRRNYSPEDIEKIWGKNLIRVMNVVQN